MTDQEDRDDGTSRRTFLKATAATGAMMGVGGVGVAQEQQLEFIGAIGGWVGQAPEEIADETNPTLELQAGQRYVVVWENGDGFQHNFVILDADGNEAVRSDITFEQGEVQRVEFEATEDMVEYFCEIHPRTMRGELEVAEREQLQPSQEEQIAPQGPEIGLEPIAEGLTAPHELETAPGVEDTYFVVDQAGQIYVVDEQDGLREEPFLDVSDRMVDLGIETLNGYDERGLLGLAFHPNFQENRRFFVRYSAPFRGGLGQAKTEAAQEEEAVTPPGTPAEAEEAPAETGGPLGEWNHTDVLAEFTATEDLTSADPESERVIMEIASPQDNHNGGALTFGPDGYLYSSIGDGGDADDTGFGPFTRTGFGHVQDWYEENAGGNGQDLEANPLGSILRIDVDAEGDDRAYGIPEDNPLSPDEYDFPEQYAWGLRNPFRMSFSADGELFVSDAGQNLWEEVNIVENGGNYGWNVKEATHCFNTDDPTESLPQCPNTAPDEPPYNGQELLDPIIEYPHRQATVAFIDGSVVIGGYTYEGEAIPELQGTYLFGNWSAQGVVNPEGEIFAASPPDDGMETPTDGTPTGETPTGTVTGEETPVETPTGETPTGETPTEAGTATATEMAFQDETETPTEETPAGTETPVETPTDGTPTDGMPTDGTPTETGTPADGDTVEDAPAAQTGPEGQYGGTWSFEELQISGAEEGRLDRYVYGFGRDQDGELYVCTNKQFRPEGNTGVVYRIVPADEGQYTPEATPTQTEGTPTDETPTGETPTGTTPGAETPTGGTETETPGGADY